MPTSELSDALNPDAAYPRARSSYNNSTSSSYYVPPQPVAQRAQEYVPHRSELEMAIAEPIPAPPPPPVVPALAPVDASISTSAPPAPVPNAHSASLALVDTSSRQNAVPYPRISGMQALQELLRAMSSAKEAQEIERKRRLAWEQEQEAKFTLKQAELERRMLEMQQELFTLRSAVRNSSPTAPSTTPARADFAAPHNAWPVTPVIEEPSSAYSTSRYSTSASPMPASAREPSTLLLSTSGQHSPASSHTAHEPTPDIVVEPSPVMYAMTPPPATFISVDPSSSAQPVNSRKRATFSLTSDEESCSDSGSGVDQPPRIKRTNHHDTRCLTIQHAVRRHMLRVMGIETDKQLPDSFAEGAMLAPDEPVRFVWDKTPKQSVHNGRMKVRVLKDLKDNRHLYKHVPDKDFSKKSLESAFDQAFVTFRQKFKSQRDVQAAQSARQRDDGKSQKSRRSSRKKLKLNNRSEARGRVKALEHITFDGALQIECMSSEESEVESAIDASSPGPSSRHSNTFRIRWLPWRSTRLVRFFEMLDEEEQLDRTLKPRRGQGRKERRPGPPKDGFPLPPRGVASWMISRRWLSMMQVAHADVIEMLKDIIIDPPGFDWNQFHALGEESEDEQQMLAEQLNGMQNVQHYTPHSDNISPVNSVTSSSLHHALSPLQ